MSFRLRQIGITADGREIVRDRNLDGDTVTIGRAPDNALALADLAVDPYHARLTRTVDDRLRIEAAGTLGFTIDGRTSRDATVNPGVGAELGFGSHRIAISRDDDGVALLTIRKHDAALDDIDPKRSFTLAPVMPNRRILSWLLFLSIITAFLAVPIYTHLSRTPGPKSSVRGDGAWDPGPLSAAHHSLANNCESCHVKAFESVRDTACRSCHKSVHDHAAPKRLVNARAEPSPFDKLQWQVAAAFGKTGPEACVTCHTEHQGAGRMEPARQQFCADCHGSLKSRLPDTKLGDAADFGTLHPQFAPAVMTSALAKEPVRVTLDGKAREDNGLTFPHQTHLDPRGGVARMAVSLGRGRGYGAALTCSNCHRPGEDGVRFQPVNMERDCESCHSLAYDKIGATVLTLRHGRIDQMAAELSVARRGAEPIVTGRRRPGAFSNSGPYYANFSVPTAGLSTVQRALGRDGVCGECHTPLYSGGKPGVMPVTQLSRFMHNGWFNHAPHKQEKCTTCHTGAATSKSAGDILLPKLAQCRTCHLGEDAAKAKVPSGCAMCHSFHPAGMAPPGRVTNMSRFPGRPPQEP